MKKSIFTTIAVTVACGMMACAPARNTGSDLSLIQNQLDASNKKLEQLSQQIAMIQMLVDTHHRALQDLKSPEDAGADPRLLPAVPGDAAAPAPSPRPALDLPDPSTVEPPPALQDLAADEDISEVPPLPSPPPEEEIESVAIEIEPTRVAAAEAPSGPPASETPQASPPAQAPAQQTASILPEKKTLQASTGDDGSTAVNTPTLLYQEAMEIFRGGDYELAAALFEDFVEAFPGNDLSDNALYWAGECKYAKKKFSEAILRFKRLVEEYPTGSKVPDALLKIGFAYISLGDMASAETSLKRVIAQYPFSTAGAKAEERLRILQKN